MYGLVLEGGGSRGAYQVGALKALFEAGYNFDAVVGTSIGAINGSMIAQKDFERMYNLWKNINFSDILDIDDRKIGKLLKKDFDMSTIKYISKKVTDTLKNKGVSTKKIREFLEANVNESKIRKSNIDFGLVTFSITDKKPIEIFIKDIPDGEVINYLLASSRLPIFKPEALNNKYYLDGGVYNNCPLSMLDPYKYKNIIVICTKNTPKIKGLTKARTAGTNVIIIRPSQELPRIINFENRTVNDMISLGYFDTQKILKKLDGMHYYVNPLDEQYYFDILRCFDENKIQKICQIAGIKEDRTYLKMLFEVIIPTFTEKIGFPNTRSYKEAVLVLLEYIANIEKVDKYKVYDFNDLLEKTVQKIKFKDKSDVNKAISKFIKYIYEIKEEKIKK